jgi:hypothetical protein
MKTFALAVLLLSLAGITSAAQADGAASGQYAKQSQEDASRDVNSASTGGAGSASSDANENMAVNAGDAQLNNTYGVCFPEWTLLEYCYEN